jgi:molybdopterin-guanine dinucleotide biosynthesis protein A
MSGGADVAGMVLAGGRSARLGGGDKTLRPIGGRPMLDHVLERLAGQVARIAISANGEPSRFAGYGLPVMADEGAQSGPLSGVLSAMRWAGANGFARVVTVAGDTPFFPRDLVQRLAAACAGRPEIVAVAASGGRIHPVFALWPVALAGRLEDFLADSTRFSVAAFLDMCETESVSFPAENTMGTDPFFNVNTPEDLARADLLARSEAL